MNRKKYDATKDRQIIICDTCKITIGAGLGIKAWVKIEPYRYRCVKCMEIENVNNKG